MSSARLDRWLPECSIRTRHGRTAAASPERLWECARGVRLADTRLLGRLVRWRIPGTSSDQPFHDLFRRYPFTVLEEDDGVLLSGLCGRIWTLARDYPRLEHPEAFRDWRQPGTVRVLFGHWVEPAPHGRCAIASEARVEPVDRAAAGRLRAIWTVVRPFERLVGTEALTVAARRAEDR